MQYEVSAWPGLVCMTVKQDDASDALAPFHEPVRTRGIFDVEELRDIGGYRVGGD
jgi:hypothetical protein